MESRPKKIEKTCRKNKKASCITDSDETKIAFVRKRISKLKAKVRVLLEV